MADVIGPNRYVPGQLLRVPEGATCDEHPDRPATKRIVGETDSYGSEIIDACEECYANIVASGQESNDDTCEGCGIVSSEVSPFRDPAEGFHSRLYKFCPHCRRQRLEDSIDYDPSCCDDEPDTIIDIVDDDLPQLNDYPEDDD